MHSAPNPAAKVSSGIYSSNQKVSVLLHRQSGSANTNCSLEKFKNTDWKIRQIFFSFLHFLPIRGIFHHIGSFPIGDLFNTFGKGFSLFSFFFLKRSLWLNFTILKFFWEFWLLTKLLSSWNYFVPFTALLKSFSCNNRLYCPVA